MMERIVKAQRLLDIFTEEIHKKNQHEQRQLITSGLKEIDEVINGYYLGEAVLIAARPANGKTNFVLQTLMNISQYVPVLLYSMENNKQQLMNKIIGLRNVYDETLNDNCVEPPDRAVDCSKSQLVLSDGKFDALEEVMLLIAHHVLHNGVKVVVIDYLQILPKTHSVLSPLEILKELCTSLEVTLILVSTVNPICETREETKKPRLTDVHIPNSLITSLDIILLLYRPEYYGILEDRFGNNTHGKLEIMIAKCRENEYPDFSVDWLNNKQL
jgi:replicative DNA helicase